MGKANLFGKEPCGQDLGRRDRSTSPVLVDETVARALKQDVLWPWGLGQEEGVTKKLNSLCLESMMYKKNEEISQNTTNRGKPMMRTPRDPPS